MSLLIQNGWVIDPKNNIDGIMDLLIEDGVIKEVAPNIDAKADQVLDATGKIVAPGLVDLHVHFREPGLEYKEDITTGSKAAAKGGVTTVVCMPNTSPVIDNKAQVRYVMERGKEVGLINVLTSGCITKGQSGSELSEMGEMKEAGAVAVTDDGKPVSSSAVMRKALEYAKMFELPVFSHSEDLSLVDGGSMNEGYTATVLGLPGIPKAAESVAVSRDVLIAEEVDGRLHVCHVSTKNAIEAIRAAKARGVKVTAETAPHYFSLTEKACEGYNTNAKMNPPLRDEEDVAAVIAALKDGTLDAIATDHAPHHRDEKELEFDQASNGIVGLETSLALGVTYLVKSGKLTMTELIEKMSLNPAEIIGIDRGTLGVGKAADLVVFDADKSYRVDVKNFASKGKNSPYDGYELYGQVDLTVTGGRIVYQNEK